MAIAPMFNVDSKHPNRIIDSKWSCFPTIEATSSTLTVNSQASTELAASEEIGEAYLGCDGTGELGEEFGDGEYLDSVAIARAQVAAADDNSLALKNLRYLPIRRITLQNFVIDGIAIKRWFDPAKLRQIVFKSGCIDAGFVSTPQPNYEPADRPKQYLCSDMKNVVLKSVSSRSASTETATVTGPESVNTILRRAPVASGLKGVELKNGKAVSSTDAVKRRAALSETAKTATTTKPSPLNRVKTVIKGFGRGRDNKAGASPSPAAPSKKNEATNAAAAAASPTAAESHDGFLHVERPVEDTAGALALPVRSLSCFGSGAFTDEVVKEAKKGKKKA